MIEVSTHKYTDGETAFIGQLVRDDAITNPAPGVLIAPAFGGLGPFEEERAVELAELGYVVLCVDYYGDGKRATSEDEASALMHALNADRPLIARRMAAALDEIKSLDLVNSNRIGAMGYCFGGKCVLDLARTGQDFKACVSFHGVYDRPDEQESQIVPSVMILHGWEDPLASPSDLLELTEELTRNCADWQVLAFGHTGHAFTNPNARAPEAGMMFSASANRRSWRALTDFLDERLIA